jgi:adenine phosphoribosyltransferase
MLKEELEKLIHIVDDFPKPGVSFKDFSPLLQNRLNDFIDALSEKVNWDEIDVVLGIESRGFILGSAMAYANKKGFVAVRKKGKLPPPILAESYELEYGTDTLEMKQNNKKLRCLVVDDVLATGGTLRATLRLASKNNYEVKGISLLIDLKFLNDFANEGIPYYSLLTYE